MAFLFDTNIISTFAKVNKLELLVELFGNEDLLIPTSVINDLSNSALSLKSILDSEIFSPIVLNHEEQALVEHYAGIKNLGKGELECIAVCKTRDSVLVTNDYKAIKFAETLGIIIIDLETILIKLKDILGRDALKQLMSEIETKDKVFIEDKEGILSNREDLN